MVSKIYNVICSYKPNYKLCDTVKELLEKTLNSILIVFDGDPGDFWKTKFKDERVKIIVLPTNCGKGYAVKTAIANLEEIADSITVIDADHQHDIEDIIKINSIAERNKTKMILGVRDFTTCNWVPKKSILGHKLIASICKNWFHFEIEDPQCGLRNIPKKYFKTILNFPWNHFNLEFAEVFLLDFYPVTVKAVYDEKNYSTTMKVFKDWFRIFKTIVYCKIHLKKLKKKVENDV